LAQLTTTPLPMLPGHRTAMIPAVLIVTLQVLPPVVPLTLQPVAISTAFAGLYLTGNAVTEVAVMAEPKRTPHVKDAPPGIERNARFPMISPDMVILALVAPLVGTNVVATTVATTSYASRAVATYPVSALPVNVTDANDGVAAGQMFWHVSMCRLLLLTLSTTPVVVANPHDTMVPALLMHASVLMVGPVNVVDTNVGVFDEHRP